MARRTRFEIIIDVLKHTKKDTLPTHIMYKCNTSYHALNKHLTQLLEKGFVTKRKIDGKFVYSITELGTELVKEFERSKFKELLGDLI